MSFAGPAGELSVVASNAPEWVKNRGKYVCSGVNDEVQIRAAIAELEASGTGGRVSLSEGTFTIGEPDVVTDNVIFDFGSGIHITGAGPGATIVAFAASRGIAPTARFMFGPKIGTNYGTIDWSVSNLTVTCEDGSDHGIRIGGARHGRVFNCHFKHNDSAVSSDEAMQVSGGTTNGEVADIRIDHNTVEGFGGFGIEIAATTGEVNAVFVTDNTFISCGNAGISFRGSQVRRCGAFRNSVEGSSQGIRVQTGEGITIADNMLFNNDENGILLSNGSEQTIVSGNQSYTNGLAGIFDDGLRTLIINNVARSNGADTGATDSTQRAGIYIGANSSDAMISNNFIRGTAQQLFGIYESSLGGGQNIYVGNMNFNNGTSNWSLGDSTFVQFARANENQVDIN